MTNYDKIASGLNSHYNEKAKKRMAEKVQLQFNQSEQGFKKAMSSKDAKEIEKIVNAVKDQLNPLYKALGVNKN